MYRLRLYVSGKAPRTLKSVEGLKKVLPCASDECQLQVLDIFEHFEQALADKVMATPTLIRLDPPPVKKIVGDFSLPNTVAACKKLLFQ